MMDEIVDYCRERIEKGSKSFAAAARLFDPDTRAYAYMLYAWCRHCDDVIDDQELGFARRGAARQAALARLEMLRDKTRRALAGDADEPVFAALQRVATEKALNEANLIEHLDGFAMDVSGRKYLTFDDTLSYCYHVAGVVGLMMANIMGVRDAPTLDRACDLGIAFQLTNIARDVMEDAAAGRVYLPAAWLRDAGVPAGGSRRSRLSDSGFGGYRASAGRGGPFLSLGPAWHCLAAVPLGLGHRARALCLPGDRLQGAPARQRRVEPAHPRQPAAQALWCGAQSRHHRPLARTWHAGGDPLASGAVDAPNHRAPPLAHQTEKWTPLFG